MILGLLAGLASGLSSLFGYFGQKEQADKARTMSRARMEKTKQDISERSAGGAGEISAGNISDAVVSQYDGYTDSDFVTDPSAFGNIISGAAGLFDIYDKFKGTKKQNSRFGM